MIQAPEFIPKLIEENEKKAYLSSVTPPARRQTRTPSLNPQAPCAQKEFDRDEVERRDVDK